MSKTLRVAVLATALLSALTMMASSAGAVTWHNSGDTAFTATGGVMAFSSTSVSLNCSGSDSTGTVTSTPAIGATFVAATMTTQVTGCTVSGSEWPWECKRTFTGTTYSSGVTNGTFDTTCTMYLGSTPTCELSGSAPATYTNPVAPSTLGSFRLPTSTSLRVGNALVTCPLGNGDSFHLAPMIFNISVATGGPSPHLGPIITRTA